MAEKVAFSHTKSFVCFLLSVFIINTNSITFPKCHRFLHIIFAFTSAEKRRQALKVGNALPEVTADPSKYAI